MSLELGNKVKLLSSIRLTESGLVCRAARAIGKGGWDTVRVGESGRAQVNISNFWEVRRYCFAIRDHLNLVASIRELSSSETCTKQGESRNLWNVHCQARSWFRSFKRFLRLKAQDDQDQRRAAQNATMFAILFIFTGAFRPQADADSVAKASYPAPSPETS